MGIDILGIDILGIDILGIDILAPTYSIIILTKVYLLITSNLAWLPAAKHLFSKTCISLHSVQSSNG